MALIVESGAGLPNSESYASDTYADTYHVNRGNSAWAALTVPQKEAALRKATDYLTRTFRSRWNGYRTKPEVQALDWPRQNVYIEENGVVLIIEDDEIPIEVKNACCEMALKSTTADLIPDIERETASETVGPLSLTYFQGSKQNKTYRSIDLLLSPLLDSGNNNIPIYRS